LPVHQQPSSVLQQAWERVQVQDQPQRPQMQMNLNKLKLNKLQFLSSLKNSLIK
jgi:hypothetical protein